MQRNISGNSKGGVFATGVNQLADEYAESSDSDDAQVPVDQEALDFQEMSLEEQYDYENPIEAM